ncbi:MAG TPA: hypothetical protein VGH73_11440 [Thermoanaerobaculia bacterium]|jgi:hypothetical protein
MQNSSRSYKSVLIVLAGLLAGLGWQGAAVAQTDDSKGSSTRHGDAAEVASMLAGSYQLKRDDADLRLQIDSQGGTGKAGTLLATVSGRFQGKDVSQQGILHLDNQGSQVLVTITPHLTQGPAAAAQDPNQLSSTEIRAACTLSLQRSSQATWLGTTQDPGNCVKALGVGQEVGQWQLQVMPGAIRVIDATSKQALTFRRTSDSGKASQ